MKQLSLKLRDEGIQRAVSNADRKVSDWSQNAFDLLRIYLVTRRESFQCEDFREYCKDKLPDPPNNRAFGWIILRAKKEGLIRHVGYKAVSNPKAHLTPASVWARI